MPDAKSTKSIEIIEGAFAVLLREGLASLSYDRVARGANVSRQLVRYYFPEPDDLMLALADRLAETYREALTEGLAGISGPDRLNVFFDFYFDLLDGRAKPRDDQAYDALFSLAAGSVPIRDNLRGQYSLLGLTLTHEIRSCYPDIPMASCSEISYLFVTIMYGHWKMVATLGLSEDHKHIARRSIDRIIASYRAVPEPSGDGSAWKT